MSRWSWLSSSGKALGGLPRRGHLVDVDVGGRRRFMRHLVKVIGGRPPLLHRLV
jgi:hypothetical protein